MPTLLLFFVRPFSDPSFIRDLPMKNHKPPRNSLIWGFVISRAELDVHALHIRRCVDCCEVDETLLICFYSKVRELLNIIM